MEKTIINLVKAFIGESQARNRYTIYSKIAKKEGYEEISSIFALTANQEAEHAKWLMQIINELKEGSSEYNEIKIEVGASTILGDTQKNLTAAIIGENYEYTNMYPEFAYIADKEGLADVANRLRAIAKAEENHEDNYRKFLDLLESGTVFKRYGKVKWVCRKCGYMHTDEEAPIKCPSCGHPQAYFETKE